MTEYEMVGWYHKLNGHEFEQAPGAGDRQGSLACCSPWVAELYTTQQLNTTIPPSSTFLTSYSNSERRILPLRQIKERNSLVYTFPCSRWFLRIQELNKTKLPCTLDTKLHHFCSQQSYLTTSLPSVQYSQPMQNHILLQEYNIQSLQTKKHRGHINKPASFNASVK